jgi:hypothetical protein
MFWGGAGRGFDMADESLISTLQAELAITEKE